MFKSERSLALRWLILILAVGWLLRLPLSPADAGAVRAFQAGARLSNPAAESQWSEEGPTQTDRSSYQDALDALQAAVARRPLDPQPWRRLGDLHAAAGRSDDALHAYGEALRHGDDSADLDRSLAQLYGVLDDPRQAARRWERYLTRRPDDRAARLRLALAQIRASAWREARAELEYLVTLEPSDPIAEAWMGLLLIGPEPSTGWPHIQRAAKDERLKSALQPVMAAHRLSLTGESPAYRSGLLGVALLKLEVAQVYPFLVDVHDRFRPIIEAEMEASLTTLALRSLLAAVYASPTYAEAYAYLGQALDQLGRAPWAQAALGQAYQLAPESPAVLTLLGLYWDRHGSPILARGYYEAAYQADAGNVALCLEIAATYANEGAYTAAEVWLLRAVDMAPNDPHTWEALADFYLTSGIGADEAGIAAATQITRLAPADARAHDLLGWGYVAVHRDAEAEKSLTRALELDPALASAYFHRGWLRARQGRYVEAMADYRRAADLDHEGELKAALERAWEELPLSLSREPLIAEETQ